MDGFLKKGEVERIEKEPYLPKYFKFYSILIVSKCRILISQERK